MSPRYVRLAIWEEKVRRQPCAVCGSPYHVQPDHIIPFSKGGTSEASNIQPLCFACNMKKGNRLTNPQLRDWVLKRGFGHFLNAVYDQDMIGQNFYDRDTPDEWMKKHPDRVTLARTLMERFLRALD